MYRSFFEGSTLLGFPLAALLLFLVLFAVLAGGALGRYRPGAHAQRMAALPLDDDTRPARRNGGDDVGA